ncbi:unnamed protein product [Calypogeia fissa]
MIGRELQLRSRKIIDMASATVDASDGGDGAHMGDEVGKKSYEERTLEAPIQEQSTEEQREGGQEQPEEDCCNPQEDEDEEEPFSSPPEQEAGLHTLKQLRESIGKLGESQTTTIIFAQCLYWYINFVILLMEIREVMLEDEANANLGSNTGDQLVGNQDPNFFKPKGLHRDVIAAIDGNLHGGL